MQTEKDNQINIERAYISRKTSKETNTQNDKQRQVKKARK